MSIISQLATNLLKRFSGDSICYKNSVLGMIKLCGFYTANNILSECCRFRGSRFPGEIRSAVAIANFTGVAPAGYNA